MIAGTAFSTRGQPEKGYFISDQAPALAVYMLDTINVAALLGRADARCAPALDLLTFL